MHFVWEEKTKNQTCSVFFAPYDGEVYETEEMSPKWFDISQIPFDEMRDDDSIRLTELLQGKEYIEYRFTFSEEDKMQKFQDLLKNE